VHRPKMALPLTVHIHGIDRAAPARSLCWSSWWGCCSWDCLGPFGEQLHMAMPYSTSVQHKTVPTMASAAQLLVDPSMATIARRMQHRRACAPWQQLPGAHNHRWAVTSQASKACAACRCKQPVVGIGPVKLPRN
jgi:hypothetical protein